MTYDPASILSRLHAAGAYTRIEEGRLRIYAPPGVLTDELKATIRNHKAELIGYLTTHEHESIDYLLDRLRKGSVWLADTYTRLEGMPHGGTGSALEVAFLRGLDVWDSIESCLREVFHYEGCVMGDSATCQIDAPVCCRMCSETGAWREGRGPPTEEPRARFRDTSGRAGRLPE